LGILNLDELKYPEKLEDEEERVKRIGEIIITVI
jgi:hypothetical protein